MKGRHTPQYDLVQSVALTSVCFFPRRAHFFSFLKTEHPLSISHKILIFSTL